MDEMYYQAKIKEFKKNNDWQGMYNFWLIEKLQEPKLWDNSEFLSEIAFGCGKLASVSANDIPRKNQEKEKFLYQKSEYRKEAERLWKRCIELMPKNPKYLSGLGYLYYQNAVELNQPRGRRDGNKRKESEIAIQYFNQSLGIDSKRIKDLYRKGYLLVEILPTTCWKDRNFELAKQYRLDGIKSLDAAITYRESLDTKIPRQQDERNRCYNEYIKSFYSLGSVYYEMIINKWDEAIFALGLRKIVDENDKISYNPQDLNHANLSYQYYNNCLVADINHREACEKVDKLYSLGKADFAKYWILSGNGQKLDKYVSAEAIKYRDDAEQYFIQALNCSWSQEKQRQKKDYIAEKLARLYITKGSPEDNRPYEEAVKVIKKYQYGRLDPYILHTLSLALMLMGRHEEAKRNLIEAANTKFNRDIWTSYFSLGCLLLRKGEIEDANEYFDKALQLKETDKLLFGKALIAYKSNRELEALEFIQKSNQVNPYNIAISKYLDIWSKKLGNVQSAIRDKNEENEEIEDYSYYMYDAFGYDEEMGMDFDEYLDKFGYS
jgi:tetratricopeptide (TPR) repeat protein